MSTNDWRTAAYDWVTSLDNPTRAKYAAHRLWKQGIRSLDRTVITLVYGYNEHETDILCSVLDELERIANARLDDYNPDLGF